MNLFRKIVRFYVDGFRNMTVGRNLWIIILIKLFIIFAVFRYPSTYNLQDSLTIQNSSSSHYTLTAMSYVSLLVPFIMAYIFYAWRALTRKKIDGAELEQEGHTY